MWKKQNLHKAHSDWTVQKKEKKKKNKGEKKG